VIVVDASAALELLLNTPAGRRVADRVFAPGESLHAPHLLDLEVVKVLRRYARAGALDTDRAREVVDDLADLPVTRYPHDVLLPRIWELRHNVTAYDAAYLVLAEVIGAPLLTRDGALVRTRGHHARVGRSRLNTRSRR
jgi:predicted nucleic acid-binding protein